MIVGKASAPFLYYHLLTLLSVRSADTHAKTYVSTRNAKMNFITGYIPCQTPRTRAYLSLHNLFSLVNERLMHRRSVIPFHFSNNSGLFYPMREELFTAYRCRTAKHSRNHSETQACVYNTGIETTQLRRALRLHGAARYLYIVRSRTT